MAKLQLHKPHGKNKYCGPTALSAITGLSRDDIATVARRCHNRPAIKGMSYNEVGYVVSTLGGQLDLVGVGGKYEPQPTGKLRKPTLAEWLERRTPEQRDQPMLISVTGHYVAVLRDTVVCSLQRGEARHILSARCRDMVFRRAWAVRLPPKVAMPAGLSTRERNKASRTAVDARRKVKLRAFALAAELRLKLCGPIYDDCIEINVADEAWWQAKLAPEGLLADGELAIDAIADVCRITGYGWEDMIDALENIKAEFEA